MTVWTRRRTTPCTLALALALACGASLGGARVAAQTPSPVPLATRFDLRSEILDEARAIEVALPEGYDEGDARYPVLYVLDGAQNLRHVVGSAEVLARTGQIPPLIIVGIESGNRMRDFTPSAVDKVPYSGGADRFLRFLGDEVIPFVEARYRTRPYRVLEGHSLAGLFTAHALLERPDLFDGYVVMSPAFWWNDEEMTRKAETLFAAGGGPRAPVFFGIGDEDGQGMQNELARFVDVLDRHAPEGLRWANRVFEGEGHMSAPLLVDYFGLKFVFDDLRLPERLRSAYDDDAFRAHEARIVEKYGGAAKQSGETYVGLGLKLMKEEDYAGAITVFERNVAAYPVFPPNYAWLADAYEASGQDAKALESYREALKRSRAIHYGQEEAYLSQIERLEAVERTGG